MDYDALYKLTHGLYVLGAKDNQRFVGSIVDAVMQVANQPWIIAVSCNNQSYTKECIEKTMHFSLSVLGKSINPHIIAQFGFQSSRNSNKWDTEKFYIKNDLPFLDDNLATIEAQVVQKIVFASNTLFLAEVKDCTNNKSEDTLTYADYRKYFKNEVLKTLQKDTSVTTPRAGKHWVCTVCEYVYDEPVPFEELPDNWVCPVCGVDKSFFVLKDI